MSNLIGRMVNVNGREGEIVRTRGASYYEVQPFDLNHGSMLLKKSEVEQFLVKESKVAKDLVNGALEYTAINYPSDVKNVRETMQDNLKDYYDKHYSKYLKLKIENVRSSNKEWCFELENGYKRTFNVGDFITLDIYVKASERVFRVSGNIINLNLNYIVLQEPKSYTTIDCNFEDDEFQYIIF